MQTQVFSVSLLLLMVGVHCQASTWENCSLNIVDSLYGVVESVGKNQVIIQNVSVCRRLTVRLQDLAVEINCGIKNCDGNASDCKEQKLGFHVRNFTFKCEIEDTGLIMKEISKLPTMRAVNELTLDGAWSELVVTMTFRVVCAKGKGTAKMTNTVIDSKSGALSISCSEGSESIVTICKSIFSTENSRDKFSSFAAKTFQEKAPEMLKPLSSSVGNMNCQ